MAVLNKFYCIAECSLGVFCNTFDLHYAIIGLESQALVFCLSGRFRQDLSYRSRSLYYPRSYILELYLCYFYLMYLISGAPEAKQRGAAFYTV